LCAEIDARSTLSAFTSKGTLPTPCTASVWKRTPRRRQIEPISRMGWTTPISLFASMMEARIVRSVSAFSTVDGSIRPLRGTSRYVTVQPCRSSRLHVSRTALCSVLSVTRWFPFSLLNSMAPLSARLSLSVAPLVKTISLSDDAPMRSAMRCRAISTAFSAAQPNEWLRLAALPNVVVKYGIISSTTRGSTGVVEW